MLAVGISCDAIAPYLDATQSTSPPFKLTISCINSLASLTISGTEPQIEDLQQTLHRDGVFARRLRVGAAYHSPQMQKIATECLQAFDTFPLQDGAPSVNFVSTVTGSIISKEELCTARYWVKNMTLPVLFFQAMQFLCSEAKKDSAEELSGSFHNAICVDQIIEIGPHAALKSPIQQTIDAVGMNVHVPYGSALFRKKSARKTLLELLGHLYSSGYPVNLREVNDPARGSDHRICLVDLPEYPFNHALRYWHESSLSANHRMRPYGHVDLLGIRSADWNPLDARWRCIVRPSEIPWIDDHKMNGTILYPASAMISMAVEAALQMRDSKRVVTGFTLRRLQFKFPVTVSLDDGDMETRFRLNSMHGVTNTDDACFAFTLFSVRAGSWSENCSGTIQIHYIRQDAEEDSSNGNSDYQTLRAPEASVCSCKIDPVEFYQFLRNQGFQYGPSFQGIESARHDNLNKATATINLSKPLEAGLDGHRFTMHPASLDAVIQVVLIALSSGGTRNIPTLVPTTIEKIWLSAEGLQMVPGRKTQNEILISANVDYTSSRNPIGSAVVLGSDQQNVRLVMDGLVTSVISSQQPSNEMVARGTQFWYNIHYGIDLDSLSPARTSDWLTRICGPDVPGPMAFFCDLRSLLISVMRRLQQETRALGSVPEAPHLQKYLCWIDQELEKHTQSGLSDVQDDLLIARVHDQGDVGKFFVDVAQNALGVLKGKTDALQLLFNSSFAKKYHATQAMGSPYLLKVEKYVEALAFKNPRMNIVEVDTGIGNLTKHMLRGLESCDSAHELRCNEYCYAHLSSAACEESKNKLATHRHKTKLCTLHIDKDLFVKGLQPASFDLVATSNVFRTSKTSESTLQMIRKLLKPGGKLILHESVHTIETTFAFGLLSEWWLNEEGNRILGSSAIEVTWHDLLVANGFSGVDFILRDFTDEACQLRSVICSTAVEPRLDEDLTPTDITMIVDGNSKPQAYLAKELEARLSRKHDFSARIVSWEHVPIAGVHTGLLLYLVDLGSPTLPRLTEKSYARLKRILLSAKQVVWVTNGGLSTADPGYGMVDGLIRTLRIEKNELQISSLSLENFPHAENDHVGLVLQALSKFTNEPNEQGLEDFMVINGALHVKRINEDTKLKEAVSETISGRKKVEQSVGQSQPFAIHVRDQDQVDTLEFVRDSPPEGELQSDEVEIEVRALGLNVLDGIAVAGKIPTTSKSTLGSECAGTIVAVGSASRFSRGDRVCAYGSGMLRSRVRAKQVLTACIPDDMEFLEASIIPQDLLFASYLLHRLVRPTNEDTMMINGGYNSITKALLSLSLCICKSVYFVASTKGDAMTLKKSYDDKVKVLSHINLAEQVRGMEKGGANVVMNFVPDEDLNSLMECTAVFGQIVNVDATRTGPPKAQIMPILRSNVSFKTVEIGEALHARLIVPAVSLQNLLDKSLPVYHQTLYQIQIYNLSQLKAGFARLRESGDRDKVAIKFDANDQISVRVTRSLRSTNVDLLTHCSIDSTGVEACLLLRSRLHLPCVWGFGRPWQVLG